MNNFPLIWELYRAQMGKWSRYSWRTLRRCRDAYNELQKEGKMKKKKAGNRGVKRKVESLKDKRKRMRPLLEKCEKAIVKKEGPTIILNCLQESVAFMKTL